MTEKIIDDGSYGFQAPSIDHGPTYAIFVEREKVYDIFLFGSEEIRDAYKSPQCRGTMHNVTINLEPRTYLRIVTDEDGNKHKLCENCDYFIHKKPVRRIQKK